MHDSGQQVQEKAAQFNGLFSRLGLNQQSNADDATPHQSFGNFGNSDNWGNFNNGEKAWTPQVAMK